MINYLRRGKSIIFYIFKSQRIIFKKLKLFEIRILTSSLLDFLNIRESLFVTKVNEEYGEEFVIYVIHIIMLFIFTFQNLRHKKVRPFNSR